jgi:hypothetical protein
MSVPLDVMQRASMLFLTMLCELLMGTRCSIQERLEFEAYDKVHYLPCSRGSQADTCRSTEYELPLSRSYRKDLRTMA